MSKIRAVYKRFSICFSHVQLRLSGVCGRFAAQVPWKATYIVFGFFVMTLYLMFTVINDRYIHSTPWYERPAPCRTPESTINLLANMTFVVSDILTKLGVHHAVCYGTLWGVLRYQSILPWDNNVDFCVLKSEIQKVPWKALKEQCLAEDLNLSFDYRHGHYIITKGPAEIILNVFYITPFGEVLEDGFENRFLWFFQDSPLSFPTRLMEAPFKRLPFYDRQIPVPHDDLEILKYLYKDNWWLEKGPPGCQIGTEFGK